MQQPYLLPGAFSSTKRRTNLAPVFVMVFLVIFTTAGYVIWQKIGVRDKPVPQGAPVERVTTAPARFQEPLMEDLIVHFHNAIQSMVRSSELVRESQRRIRAVMPAMDRNYLYLERRRLEAADSLAARAIRECNHAAEELEVAQKLTQQKISEGGKQ